MPKVKKKSSTKSPKTAKRTTRAVTKKSRATKKASTQRTTRAPAKKTAVKKARRSTAPVKKKTAAKKTVVAKKKVTAKKKVVAKANKKTTAKTARKKTPSRSRASQQKTNSAIEPNAIASLVQQFIDTLNNQLGKQLNTANKQLERAEKQLLRTATKSDKAKERKAIAAEKWANKKTQGTKNQLERAKEALAEARLIWQEARDECSAAKAAAKVVVDAEKQLKALSKLITQFDRDWKKAQTKAKKTTPRKKTKKTTTKATGDFTDEVVITAKPSPKTIDAEIAEAMGQDPAMTAQRLTEERNEPTIELETIIEHNRQRDSRLPFDAQAGNDFAADDTA